MLSVTLTITAILSILIGIIVIVWRRSLNYAIGLWLIVTGLLQILSLSGYV